MEEMLKQLQEKLSYRFQKPELLQHAVIHSSYANEHHMKREDNNERLEFLGDAILGMTVAKFLYQTFPDRPEGELTRMRADMVCERALAEVANRLSLGQHLLLGHGEERFGGRGRDSILADAVESVIAATYVDGGMEAAVAFIRKFILCNVPSQRLRNADYKTALQELVQQKKNQVLSYALVGESGPDHDKKFTVGIYVGDSLKGTGTGHSKQEAQTAAAREGVKKYKRQDKKTGV